MIPEFLKENSFENVFADLLTILKMFYTLLETILRAVANISIIVG